jgi:hypothetical protein
MRNGGTVVGITTGTWRRPAPVLADLGEALAAEVDPAVSYKGLFDGPATHAPDAHFVVLSPRDLADEVKSLGTLLALDAVWRRVLNPYQRLRRLVVVDETWLLMQQPEGAKFLYRMAKAARKYRAGVRLP